MTSPLTIKLLIALVLGVAWIVIYEVKQSKTNFKNKATMADIKGQVTGKLDQAKSWYQSKGVWGAIIAILAYAAQAIFGLDLDAYILGVHADLYDIAEAIGILVAMYGRIAAKTEVVIGKVKDPKI